MGGASPIHSPQPSPLSRLRHRSQPRASTVELSYIFLFFISFLMILYFPQAFLTSFMYFLMIFLVVHNHVSVDPHQLRQSEARRRHETCCHGTLSVSICIGLTDAQTVSSLVHNYTAHNNRHTDI